MALTPPTNLPQSQEIFQAAVLASSFATEKLRIFVGMNTRRFLTDKNGAQSGRVVKDAKHKVSLNISRNTGDWGVLSFQDPLGSIEEYELQQLHLNLKGRNVNHVTFFSQI